VQDVRAAVLDELRAVAQQRAQGNQLGFGAEGVGEQAVAVQGLNPLRVGDIRFTAGHPLSGSSIDEATAEAPLLQQFKEGNPVDASGFHGDGLDGVSFKPYGETFQIGGIGTEGAHELGIRQAGHADNNLVRADVGASGVGLEAGEAREGMHFSLGGGLLDLTAT